MAVHKLKLAKRFFKPVETCDKNFEIRKNDRDYKVGDQLILMEWCEVTKSYTGAYLIRFVTYILHDAEEFGLDKSFCIMSIDKSQRNQDTVLPSAIDFIQ